MVVGVVGHYQFFFFFFFGGRLCHRFLSQIGHRQLSSMFDQIGGKVLCQPIFKKLVGLKNDNLQCTLSINVSFKVYMYGNQYNK